MTTAAPASAKLPDPGHIIEVIGHGGAGDFYPGNTRQSIEKALELVVDRIEIDIQRSADGDLVLVHDDELTTASGKKVPVAQIPTEHLRSLLPGFLTFREVVKLVDDQVPFLLDVKNPGYEQEIIDAIHHWDLGCCISASSTHVTVLKRLRDAYPDIRLALSTGHMASGMPTRVGRTVMRTALRAVTPHPLAFAAKQCGATAVTVFHRVCTRQLVEVCHQHHLRVLVWTVDRPQSIRRAISLGVDGITSNRPDLVWEELIAAGHPDLRDR
ncbi:MAG TPA: glycerophosphodiester phosphodiesterase [Thermomicrobiales bacterium]|nr:glycerophosphodiester phosphodiesterase [Thermomicrobiales bacterium]